MLTEVSTGFLVILSWNPIKHRNMILGTAIQNPLLYKKHLMLCLSSKREARE
jgi:hypothetical protein